MIALSSRPEEQGKSKQTNRNRLSRPCANGNSLIDERFPDLRSMAGGSTKNRRFYYVTSIKKVQQPELAAEHFQ